MTKPAELTATPEPIHPEIERQAALRPYPSYRLMNLHEILSIARMEKDDEEDGVDPLKPMVAGSYRIEPELKELAEKICERNLCSLSEFLRGCVRTLIFEYR